MNTSRRHVLAWLAASTPCLQAVAESAPRGPRPFSELKVGIEAAASLSGLAAHLRTAIGRDIGLPLNLQAGPGLELMDQLKAGTLDAALTQVPLREEDLDRQGLIHTRKLVAVGSYVLLGPAADPAGVKAAGGILPALDRIVAAGQADPAHVAYVSHAEPSGTHEAEAALWKALGPRPIGNWMHLAPAGAGPRAAAQAAAQLPGGGYALIEQGALAGLRTPLRPLVTGDPKLLAPYHIALPFASHHSAGKLLVGWLASPTGQRAVRAFGHGYRGAEG